MVIINRVIKREPLPDDGNTQSVDSPHPPPSSNITSGILITIFIASDLVLILLAGLALLHLWQCSPPPTQRESVPGSWMEMGGGILSGHRSPILTSAICDQLAKICSPNSDLKYITIYVEGISQFFHFSTLVKIGPYAVLQLCVSRQCLVVTFPCVCVSVSVCPCVKVSSMCRTILPSIT